MCEGPHDYIPVPDTAEVRLRYQTAGGLAENVINFSKSGGWDVDSLADLAAAVEDSWESNISPIVAETISLTDTIATDISSQTGPQVTDIGGIAGGQPNPALPNNVTFVVSFRTANRGRSYRGRLYHVGLTENFVTLDSVGPSNAAAFQGDYENFFADIATAVPGAVHVVVSRCQNGEWLTTGIATPVTSYFVDETIDSQRRRLAGRGA